MTKPVLITTDLDRTLLFSRRATAQLGGGLPAEPVEASASSPGKGRRQRAQAGAELSHAARDCLAALPPHVRLCVATSRSVSRLARLRLPFAMPYAIAANGGVVLIDGVPEPGWEARIENGCLQRPRQPTSSGVSWPGRARRTRGARQGCSARRSPAPARPGWCGWAMPTTCAAWRSLTWPFSSPMSSRRSRIGVASWAGRHRWSAASCTRSRPASARSMRRRTWRRESRPCRVPPRRARGGRHRA